MHHTKYGLITGAKIFNEKGEEKISNYEASILDLLPGKTIKKRGFEEW